MRAMRRGSEEPNKYRYEVKKKKSLETKSKRQLYRSKVTGMESSDQDARVSCKAQNKKKGTREGEFKS